MREQENNTILNKYGNEFKIIARGIVSFPFGFAAVDSLSMGKYGEAIILGIPALAFAISAIASIMKSGQEREALRQGLEELQVQNAATEDRLYIALKQSELANDM